MRSEDLDRALGETPQSFVEKMESTLAHLPQEKTRTIRRMPCQRVLVLAILALMLCTTAVAIAYQGLSWYYNNRFTAYQQYEPEKYNNIMRHLTADVPQMGTDDAEIQIAVTETSWTPETGLLVVALSAQTRTPETNELHPMWNLDADGAYVGPDESAIADEEERCVHWLWANDTRGPVEDMLAPGKALLLVDCDTVLLGEERLQNYSMDAFVDEEGRVQFILEFELPQEQQEKLLLADTDQDGLISLTVQYIVTHYTTDDVQLYTGGRTGEITFQLAIQ